MKLQTAIKILKIIVRIGFYLLLLFIILFIAVSVLRLSGGNINEGLNISNAVKVRSLDSEVTGRGTFNQQHTGSYQQISTYFFRPNFNTPAGYYLVFIRALYYLISLSILWLLLRTLDTISNTAFFHTKITRYIRLLAFMYMASDLLGLIDYFVMRAFLHQEFPAMHFRPEINFGEDLITGLIIFVITFIYARGVQLQEEQQLTI
ncbi:DUF2975 domain-containing protein [Niabella drilacis]|uniref:DUF2975 domain-containing protein n=1 Tax=Niabella drilacis (strain DSM 25811 / CCM 8410 / CCUG 62505 / LMG 26954 / E90) TaxID=1285928 RepID=A0A1G6VUT4_NIADE|nr:DUF2975 domain-containing protein [Niabella drilacis]SDD57339.1 Protein of unknown function [Niabella drilacis]